MHSPTHCTHMSRTHKLFVRSLLHDFALFVHNLWELPAIWHIFSPIIELIFAAAFGFFSQKPSNFGALLRQFVKAPRVMRLFHLGEIKHCDALTTRCIHNAKSHYNTKYLNQNGKYAFISVINRAFRFQLRTTCRSWIAQGIIIPKLSKVELLLIEAERKFLRNTSSKKKFSSCVCTLHTIKKNFLLIAASRYWIRKCFNIFWNEKKKRFSPPHFEK